MVERSGSLPNVPPPIVPCMIPAKLGISISSVRDRVFKYPMLLIDNDKKSINAMLQVNGIYNLLDTVSMFFQDIECNKCRVNNTR